MRISTVLRAAAISLSALVLWACGTDTEGDSTGAGEDLGDLPTPTGEEVMLLEGHDRFLPSSVEDNIERIDPRTDGWRSEVLHALAKSALHEFLHHLLEGELDAAREGLTDDCRIPTLRPAELESVFEDGVVEVRRAVDIPDETFAADELARLTAELLAPLKGAPELHERMKIVEVDELDARSFRTRSFTTLYGNPDGRSVQESTNWTIEWSVVGDDESALIRSIRVEDFEEVRAARPLFGELSEYVFDFEGFEDFARGTGALQHRTDRLIGNPFWGFQGLAIGDINGDGLEDVYVCQPAGLPNRLLLRNADGTVTDDSGRSATAYLDSTASALILDMDGDGDQDLVLALFHLAVIAFNDGNGVFRECRPLKGVSQAPIYSMSAADPDEDGDLDLYVCRHSDRELLYAIPTPYYDANNGSRNSFFRNEGDGRFTDATEELGFDVNNTKFSYAALWEDLDSDGDVDLYVANDFGRNNYFRNDGGHFNDVAEEAGVLDISAGMGASVADFDLDGDMDLYVTNMFSSAGQRIVPQTDLFMGGENLEVHGLLERYARGNTLFSNSGDGTFEDVTDASGVAPGGWGWGARFVDFNNDGYEDLYSPCGFVTGPDPDDL